MQIAKGTFIFSRKDRQLIYKLPQFQFSLMLPQSHLNKRVNAYFKENNLRKTGNWRLHLKTVILLTFFITPYVLLLSLDLNQWIKLGLCVLLGFGMAGIGMNVMHEGNHGSYSRYPWVNKLMGGAIYILAGNVFNWKVQHNILHHSFTNIEGHDEDLDAGTIMRFSKHAKWRKIHRFQHLYFIFLYGLMTLRWVITTDFIQLKRYLKLKLSYKKKTSPTREWLVLVLSKSFYVALWIVLPLLVLDLGLVENHDWLCRDALHRWDYSQRGLSARTHHNEHHHAATIRNGYDEKYLGDSPTVYHREFRAQKLACQLVYRRSKPPNRASYFPLYQPYSL